MLRLAVRSSSRAAAAAVGAAIAGASTHLKMETFLPHSCSSTIRRRLSSTSTSQELLASEMIQYALADARSQKSDDSYARALLVLELGLSNLRAAAGGGDDADNAIGMLMLAMATLHYESGRMQDAMEKLEMIHQLGHTSLPIKVAAWEGLVGLNLESGQDANASLLADDCSNFVRTSMENNGYASKNLKPWANAIKGLVDLVNGDLKSGELSFNGSQHSMIEGNDYVFGNVSLSHGELLHCSGDFQSARSFYEKALSTSDNKDAPSGSYSAANMDPEEVVLGANCALGQLLSHSGKFEEAEEFLTKALVKAEGLFGTSHPKVGVVLICVAMMYKHKAKTEGSSSILIQEGLYRRATGLLKAPSLNDEVSSMQVDRSDILALVRGGYAELLCIQQNRKEEGERMRKWAEATWRNRRMSLAQALEFTEPSNAAVVDTRICRVL